MNAASASASDSLVPLIGQQEYRIPLEKNFRYAARWLIYPMRRATKAAATVDAAAGEDTKVLSPSPLTLTLTPEDDGYQGLQS